ncbi:MAG: hypothetical protein DSZ05_02190 [Sulfurospirillum sp.]|nr:MAG: hypothetical protein DSZ05_02190 [Sulfurospirillum sp.]
MTLETHNNLMNREQNIDHKPHEAKHNVLVITQNEIELALVKTVLEGAQKYKIYEAGNLKTAFKIASHLDIDLIIVDDKLPTAEGFAIIDKLNQRKLLKEVPKLLLISSSFQKERYNSYRDINLDFIRKPVDPVMLQARVNTLFTNMHKHLRHSVFEAFLDTKLQEAKEFLGIYKSFLDVDENILFIYDKKQNRVVEGNKVFMRFFEDVEDVNKVLQRRRLFQKYIPYQEDANYLNHYDFKEWSEIAGMSDDFRFALRIEKEGTHYSFTVLTKRVEISDQEMYVVKLLNNQNYLPVQNESFVDEKMRSEINNELSRIKEEISLDGKVRSYKRINYSLRKISEIVNGQVHEDVWRDEEGSLHLVNAYFIVASLLKNYSSYKTLYLNGTLVDRHLEENQEEIYVRIDPNALYDTVKGIIDSYFTALVEYDKRRIRIDLYRHDDELMIEIRASERREFPKKESSIIGKLLKKEDLRFSENDESDILPKNVQQAIAVLNANVKHFSADGDTVFLVKIPLLEKS